MDTDIIHTTGNRNNLEGYILCLSGLSLDVSLFPVCTLNFLNQCHADFISTQTIHSKISCLSW